MLAAWPIYFERPLWLLVLILIVPSFLLARRSIGGLSRRKAYVSFGIRSALLFLLAGALSQPVWVKRGEGLTTMILLDRSQSIPLPLKRAAVDFLKQASEAKEIREDRIGVITIAKGASIAAMPDRFSEVTAGQDAGDLSATNLAAGVRLALAVMPDDTANRIVLASDGNETVDSVLAAAEVAKANNVPIDIFVLEYEHTNEVLFERIRAPTTARLGSSANIQLHLRSQAPATGQVYLTLNGEQLDLNGQAPGDGLPVELEPGINARSLTVDMDQSGAQVFEAVFEPSEAMGDGIQRNNQAMAVTFVGGDGRVLIIDDGTSESEHLVAALREAEIETDVRGPDALVGGLVFLSGYDAIVLANMPRYAFDDSQDQALHDYVHDIGGGLVMLGGPLSFGAGSWIDSDVAKALPVRLDPPQTRQMLRGALALILHSCEMPQGNYWGKKVAESAIKALSSLDYVGLIEFGFQGGGWVFPLQVAGDKTAALAATNKLTLGDMPAFGPSLQVALKGLANVNAGQRHVIIISDGDPSPPSNKLIQDFIDARITVSTVMVGGHGTAMDRNNMRSVANDTGGRFFNVKNPKNLPQIFFKEAQLISRSLIQEGDIYQPQVISGLPGPTRGFEFVPSVDGYVLTAAREGLAQVPIAVASENSGQLVMDPIFAYWNFGLGKAIAYTSDITGRWGNRWASWPQFQAFWEQAMRWVMRPSSPANMLVTTRLEGDRAIVEIEALEADASFLNFLRTRAVVLGPTGLRIPLPLQQTGPGQYRGEFVADEAGAYLVNVNYAGGAGDSVMAGTLQAAVTVSYAREFRAVKHNRALLRDLAERTNGRELDTDNAALIDLFDRQDLEVPKSPKFVWDLLAILAASLFVIDVAARRLSISARKVAEAATRAVEKRADASEATVAAWKRARGQVAHRREPTDAGDVDRTRKFDAGEDDQATAIDVGAEMSSRAPGAPKPAKRRTDSPADATTEDEDFTSRLLAARRRAQRDEQGEQDEGHGNG